MLKTANFWPKTSQGITTEVLMSDGISYAPVDVGELSRLVRLSRALDGLELSDYQGWQTIADYMSLLDGHTAQNTIALVPYANMRVLAAGWRRGPLDDSQMNIVRQEIAAAMEAGAAGLSTGLDYVAECFATTDELVEACRAIAPARGLYVTHVRYKKGTLAGVQEAVEIGKRAGVRCTFRISRLLRPLKPRPSCRTSTASRSTKSTSRSTSIRISAARRCSTTCCRTRSGKTARWRFARLREPEVRQRLAALLACFPLPPEKIILAWTATKAGAARQGSSLARIAEQTGRSAADVVCDLLIAENLAALSILSAEEDQLIEPFLQHPKFMLGSDGIWFPDAHVHPRVYGSVPRMLGPLVRDKKLFSLEAAVHKMTGVPAERFGLADRGTIEEGAAADLMLFNPATIADRATYADPHQVSLGIEHVIVNGVQIVAGGQPVENLDPELPGRAARRGLNRQDFGRAGEFQVANEPHSAAFGSIGLSVAISPAYARFSAKYASRQALAVLKEVVD